MEERKSRLPVPAIPKIQTQAGQTNLFRRKKAFFGCKNLNKINIRATKLKSKTIGAKALKGIYAKAEIKTPKKKKEAYKKIIQSKGAGKKVKFKN